MWAGREIVLEYVCAYGGYFFFQAEDGIRDYKVTGVQTCALPISPSVSTSRSVVIPRSSKESPRCATWKRKVRATGTSRSNRQSKKERFRGRGFFALDRKSVV